MGLDELHKLAKQAEARSKAWYHENYHGEDCTCTPVSDACPVCVMEIESRYGDNLPYTTKTMMVECPDCAGNGKIDVYGVHTAYSTQPNVKTVNCPTCDGCGKVEA